MNNVNAPAFRSSMSGFNKKDVNEYIAKLNREFGEQLAERDKQIKSLTEKLDEEKALAAKASEAGEREAAEQLEHANKLIAAQNEQLELLTSKQKELEDELAASRARLDNYIAIDSKISKYEAMTARMGEIYVDAAADADRIRNDAREEADSLKSSAEEYYRTKKTEIEKQLQSYIENGKTDIGKLFEEAHRKITDILLNFEMQAYGAIKNAAPQIGFDEEDNEAFSNTASDFISDDNK